MGSDQEPLAGFSKDSPPVLTREGHHPFAGVPVNAGSAGGDRPTRPPRSRGAVHAVLFVGALAAWAVIGFWVAFAVFAGLTEDLYLSEQARDAAVGTAVTLAGTAYALFALVTMGLVTRRVGYRVRDAFFVFVPLYSYAFVVKMLWRWTSLPDRYWDRGSVSGIPDDQASVEAAGPTEKRPAVVLVMGVLGLLLLAGTAGYFLSQGGSERPAADEWRTTRAYGMSLSLPPTFKIFTDPDEVAQAASETGIPSADEAAEVIRQFPDLFVFFALDPAPDGIDADAYLTVMRFPSIGVSLDEFVEGFSEGIDETGFVEVFAQTRTTVGTGPYRAVRFDQETEIPEVGVALRGVDYVVDGGSQIWLLEFATIAEEYGGYSTIFDRSIASLTLP